MTFWTVPDALIERFPELAQAVEKHLDSYRRMNVRPYPHEFLEEYLLPLLTSDPPSDRRANAYEFLEEVLTNPDEDLAAAGVTAVLEPIVGDQGSYRTAREHMGRRTSELAEELLEAKRA